MGTHVDCLSPEKTEEEELNRASNLETEGDSMNESGDRVKNLSDEEYERLISIIRKTPIDTSRGGGYWLRKKKRPQVIQR